METREMTCIACPMGCRMTVRRDEAGEITVEHYGCKRGIAYGAQEFACPMRQVTSTVRVLGGGARLCAVKTERAIPKAKVPEVLEAIRAASACAPIIVGQRIVFDIAGTGVDLVATAACAEA